MKRTKNIKKVISLIIVLITLVQLLQSPLYAMKIINNADKNDYYELAISALIKLEIFKGYPDGNMKEEYFITRAEMTTVATRLLDIDKNWYDNYQPIKIYPDAKNHWAINYLSKAYEHKFAEGDPDGNFRPEDDITLIEAIRMILVANGINISEDEKVTDWKNAYKKKAESLNMLNYISSSNNDNVTRKDVILMIYNLLISDMKSPIFNIKGDTYSDTQQIELSSETTESKIYYTIDGTNPIDTGILYTESISINKSTTVKAVVVKKDIIYSPVVEETYIININNVQSGNNGIISQLPVVIGNIINNKENEDKKNEQNKDVKSDPPVILISNTEYDVDTNFIITENEKFKLYGEIKSNTTISKIEYYYESYLGNNNTIINNGTYNWAIDIPLEIGTNKIIITAYDSLNQSNSKEIYINRLSTEIILSDKVKMADESDITTLYNEFIGHWVDDNNTDDESDDTIVLLVTESSLLLNQIKSGLLASGEIYMIPQGDLFVTGFVGEYVNHQAPRGTDKFPLSIYSDILYEEIIFITPYIGDIISSDISLDFTGAIDTDNPISFAVFPDGVGASTSQKPANQTFAFSSNQKVQMFSEDTSNEKLSLDELLEDIGSSFSYSVNNNGLSIGIKWDNVVIVDADGDKDTKSDQITFTGELGMKNILSEGGVEWHPNFNPFNLDVLPQQIKTKISYDIVGKLELKYSASMNTKNVVKSINDDFENKAELFGLKVSGVDFTDKIVLGVIGIKIPTYTPLIANSIKTQAKSSSLLISPSIVIMLLLNLDGSITAEGSMTFAYNSYNEKGYNFQKDGFEGAYGTQEENIGQQQYSILNAYKLDIYDLTCASKNDKESNPEMSFVIEGSIEAQLEMGLGAGVGLMFCGFMPALIDGNIFARTEASIEGKLQVLPTFDIDGNISAYFGIGAKANIAAKLMIKAWIFNGGFNFNKSWKYMLFEKTWAVNSNLTGRVYGYKDEEDIGIEEIIENAKVTIRQKDVLLTNDIIAYTDENGQYNFISLNDGNYEFKVEKEGFEPYIDEFSFPKTTKKDVYLKAIEPDDPPIDPPVDPPEEVEYSMYGKVYTSSGSSGIIVSNVKITLINNDTGSFIVIYSNEDGEYIFENLESGYYTIMTEKEGYSTYIYSDYFDFSNDIVRNIYLNQIIEEVNDEWEYVINQDGTTATITKYIGNEIDLYIPPYIDGYEVTTLSNGLFSGNENIETVLIQEGITHIGSATFSNCTNLKKVVIPKSVIYISSGVFSNCTNLSDIELGNINSIGFGAFYNCISLTSIIIPESVMSIFDEAFKGCTNLTTIIVSEGVIHIGRESFAECSSLTNIILPNSMKEIYYNAFLNCTELKSVIFKGSPPIFYYSGFGRDKIFNNVHQDFAIYYYEGTSGWTTPTYGGYPCYPIQG